MEVALDVFSVAMSAFTVSCHPPLLDQPFLSENRRRSLLRTTLAVLIVNQQRVGSRIPSLSLRGPSLIVIGMIQSHSYPVALSLYLVPHLYNEFR